MTPWAGFWGMVAGSVGALGTYLLYKAGVLNLGSDMAEAFWGAIIAFVLDAVVTVAVSLLTTPRPVEELQGLVYGMAAEEERLDEADPMLVPIAGAARLLRPGADRRGQPGLHLGARERP
jgi:Na+/proline symporter